MIKVEGYKAFHGIMKITFENPEFKPLLLTADWLYKPDNGGYWYGYGGSYPADACEIVEEL